MDTCSTVVSAEAGPALALTGGRKSLVIAVVQTRHARTLVCERDKIVSAVCEFFVIAPKRRPPPFDLCAALLTNFTVIAAVAVSARALAVINHGHKDSAILTAKCQAMV